jgi:hypothetical protein
MSYMQSDGAIAMDPVGTMQNYTVRPYFGNLAAMGLVTGFESLKDHAFLDASARWVKWYIDRAAATNWVITDVQGNPGNWKAVYLNGAQRPPYDSVDAYAATFLTVANSVYQLSSDVTLKQSIRAAAPHVLSVLSKTLQPSGSKVADLTTQFMPPDATFCYAEDNCEVFAGLQAAIKMAVGSPDLNPVQLAPKTLAAIVRYLYDADHLQFRDAVALDGVPTNVTLPGAWYPNRQIQILAIARLPVTATTSCLYAKMKHYYGLIPRQLPDVDATKELDHVDEVVWWGLAALNMRDAATVADMASRLRAYDLQSNRGGVHHIGLACQVFAAT